MDFALCVSLIMHGLLICEGNSSVLCGTTVTECEALRVCKLLTETAEAAGIAYMHR